MSGLVDIGPLSASVTLRGKDINVMGIGADTLVVLLARFPKLYEAIGKRQNLSAADFIDLGPEIVATVIATATGDGDDPAAVKGARNLTIGEQMIALEKILSLTFPQGFGPFVESLSRVVEGSSGEAATKGAGLLVKALASK